jgi:Rap guanine nucleotide exchange factor 2
VKKDLTFIHLGNDSKLQGLVNFEKLRMISKEIRHCCNMASAQYDVSDVFSNYATSQEVFSAFGNTSTTIYATTRRKRRSAAQPSAKRLYEQGQMVKRVRAYLTQLHIEDDEHKLQTLSYACEAPPGE